MGLLQPTDATYLTVSCGKLVNKKKEISVYGVSGHIQEIIEYEDTYEGTPLMKIQVKLTDKGETFLIQFTEKSWYAISFFQRLHNLDFSKQTTIGVSASEKNEKMSFCWLKQGSIKIEKDADFPMPEKKKYEGNDIVIWTKTTEKFKTLINWANNQIVSILPETEASLDVSTFSENPPEDLFK